LNGKEYLVVLSREELMDIIKDGGDV